MVDCRVVESDLPPDKPADNESRYLRQLLDAYGDHLGTHFPDSTFLDSHNQFKRDYLRQRERFTMPSH